MIRALKIVQVNVQILALLIVIISCNSESKKGIAKKSSNKLEILENSFLKVGIIPNAGGRVVLLQKPNMKNILNSDSSLWNYKFTKPMIDLTSVNITKFNGHIVWLGPKSEWWSQQNVNIEKRDKKSAWPPDPFLIYAENKIIERGKNSITLLSPESVYSNVQLTKKISLKEDGKVEYYVNVRNICDSTIAWDIWMNTRLDCYDRCYIPIGENSFKIESKVNSNRDTVEYNIIDGYFTFKPILPSNIDKRRVSKAFLNPNKNYIAAFTKSEMFVIWITLNDKDTIHPEHGQVEIYNLIENNPKLGLLELEYHTSFNELLPGESMEGQEVWEVVEYNGGDSTKEHIDFINDWFKDIL